MRATGGGDSRLLLIDLQSSFYSARQIPLSTTLSYLSSKLRRTCGVQHRRIASSPSPAPSLLRRPSDPSRAGNGLVSEKPSSAPIPCISLGSEELGVFLELLPARMRSELSGHPEVGKLIEVVMDLGREPLARFPSGDWVIAETPVTVEDLTHAISKVGDFSDDNRSGINSSLHRISAIRNRKLQIIGLTCRVGRAISGSAEIIRDLVESGGSILVIGCPGVGKTTLIREIARMLADDQGKRVVIVDTSNEIGGDGDIPHSGIGSARRMQVPNVDMQHHVMIEAVENHMPQTIIIDEIGTELEALAACTIAQRGVQLVGTAHGMTIENIVKNPSLQILIGGIESVTLGDEAARKRKVQKTILERKGPPAFTCAVELISKTECRVHHRLDATVDALLAGKTPRFEIRQVEAEDANISLDPAHLPSKVNVDEPQLVTIDQEEDNEAESEEGAENHQDKLRTRKANRSLRKRTGPFYIYTYKILEADLLQVVNVMGLEDKVDVVDDIGDANAILVSVSELKQNPWIRTLAKFHQVPIYVIKSNTMAQMVKAIHMILGKKSSGHASKHPPKSSVDMEIEEFLQKDIEIEDDAPERKPTLEEIDALEEVRLAIEYIVIPGGEPVELLPRRSDIIAQQLKLVESYQLIVENSGTDLQPRLQILPQRKYSKSSSKTSKPSSVVHKEIALETLTGNFGATTVGRLPLLPE